MVVLDAATPPGRGPRPPGPAGVPLVGVGADMVGGLETAGLAGARAVVCVEPGDAGELHNLHVALHVREHRPDVRIVTALNNAAIGRAVADDTGPGTVLDVADLVTPALVEACLQSPAHALDVAGHRFVAVATAAPAPATLRELYGDLAPLAVTDHHGSTLLCPGRDHRVAPGEAVTVLGSDAEIAAAGVGTGVPPGPGQHHPGTRRPPPAAAAATTRTPLTDGPGRRGGRWPPSSRSGASRTRGCAGRCGTGRLWRRSRRRCWPRRTGTPPATTSACWTRCTSPPRR